MELFNNEVIRNDAPFRTGPLRTIALAEEVTFYWVNWYNNECLYSYLGDIPPVKYERDHSAQIIG